jgi:cob(I)alamin adenosyltransferase
MRLTKIQSRLFDIGAVVATPPSQASASQLRM